MMRKESLFFGIILLIIILGSITTKLVFINFSYSYGNSGVGYSIKCFNPICYISAGSINGNASILKINNKGEIIWRKNFINNNVSKFYDIQETVANEFIAVGFEVENDDKNILVARLNNDGEIIWYKSYGNIQDKEEALSIKKIGDDKFIIVGRTYLKNKGFYQGKIMKIDLKGNVIWDHIYTTQSSCEFKDIVCFQKDKCLIIGNIYPDTNQSDALVLMMDKSTNIIWEKIYSNKNINSIQKTVDNNLIIAGMTTKNMNSTNYSDINIFKIDTTGDIVWDKSYDYNYNEKLYTILSKKDKGYISAGIISDDNNQQTRMIIIKVNELGELIYDHTKIRDNHDFKFSNKHKIFAMDELPSGEIIVTGKIQEFKEKKFWIGGFSQYDIMIGTNNLIIIISTLFLIFIFYMFMVKYFNFGLLKLDKDIKLLLKRLPKENSISLDLLKNLVKAPVEIILKELYYLQLNRLIEYSFNISKKVKSLNYNITSKDYTLDEFILTKKYCAYKEAKFLIFYFHYFYNK